LEDEESAATPGYAAPCGARNNSMRRNSGGVGQRRRNLPQPGDGFGDQGEREAGTSRGAGELMLVLEAMKMETNVTAPRAGIVKSVHVKRAIQ
jgi:acetyl/propionyl-CoA carboxylase alpha subunit